MSEPGRFELLQQLVTENPRDPFARYGLALEYANRGEIENALAEFRQIIEANPDYTPAYQMAAQTLLRTGRTDEARQMLQAGIACARRTGVAKALSEMQGMLDELG